jgi:hypothetical protein
MARKPSGIQHRVNLTVVCHSERSEEPVNLPSSPNAGESLVVATALPRGSARLEDDIGTKSRTKHHDLSSLVQLFFSICVLYRG